MRVIPAILETTFDRFAELRNMISGFSDMAQIDVMDGFFVPSKSFDETEKINELGDDVKYELHLMVKRPIEEIQKWKKVNNITRVIFHIECDDEPEAVISEIKNCGWSAGLAINPETDTELLDKYFEKVDEILFLTVHPGEQGAKFLPEVGEKIRSLSSLPGHPPIGADGGINENNIAEVKSWGAEIFCIGSAITRANNPKESYKELNSRLK